MKDSITSGKLLIYERRMLGDHRKHKENKNGDTPSVGRLHNLEIHKVFGALKGILSPRENF